VSEHARRLQRDPRRARVTLADRPRAQRPAGRAGVRPALGARESGSAPEVLQQGVGIIGLGNTRHHRRERALGLRMKVIAYEPFVTHEVAGAPWASSWSRARRALRGGRLHRPIHTSGLRPDAPSARCTLAAHGGGGGAASITGAPRRASSTRPRSPRMQMKAAGGRARPSTARRGAAPRGPSLLQVEQVICTPHPAPSPARRRVNVAVAIAQQSPTSSARHHPERGQRTSLSPEVLGVLARTAAAREAGAPCRRSSCRNRQSR